MIILKLLLLLTNLHLKLISTQGTGADKLVSTQRVKLTKYCDIDAHLGRLAPMWQQSGTLLFCSCHGIAGFLVNELQI